MRAVAYARISVRGEDINNQVGSIKEWAGRHGYEVVAVFKDENVSGATNPLEREKFKMLLEFCKDNDIKTILVYDLSRFGRSLAEAVEALKKLLEQGYTIIFTRFNLKADFNDIAGKVMIYTLLMAAELERDFMHMRLEAARAAGKRIGRPPKVSDEKILEYYNKYGKYNKKYAWLRLKEDGHDMSYDRFLKRLKKLLR